MTRANRSRQLAIVGAGPAGLVAAIAAQQAGFECTVYEQAASFDRVGGAIGIQGNGLRVLEAIGVLEAFRSRIELIHYAVVEAPPGRVVSRADLRAAHSPYSSFAVALRYDLHEVLAEAARAHGVVLNFGARCTSAHWQPHGVVLQFSNGASTEPALLFACDGVNSVVRDKLGFKAHKQVVGEAYLRVVAPLPHPHPERVGEFWANDGRRAGAFPLRGKRSYVFCSVPLGQWQQIRDNELDRWLESWDDFGPIYTLMRSVEDWRTAVYDELSDLRVERWQRNGVFLLGDAAHAMTPNLGQGANSAMVDALVLVNLLTEAAVNRNWRDVGRRYEQLRRPFVTRIQNAALLGGRMAAWTNPAARALRAAMLRTAGSIAPLRNASLRLVSGYNPAEQPFLHAPVRMPGA